MKVRPDKTFGLASSTDLYLKLIHDIERLRAGAGTKAVQYAAFDAAVTASHILDWVLHEIDAASHLRLTGVPKGYKPTKKGELGPVAGFIHINGGRMGGIEFCRQISNSVKHMTITMGPVMTDMSTGSTVKLDWTKDKITNAYAIAYIQVAPKGEKINVVELFQTTAEQWFLFLEREGLWVEQPPED
ncbi:MULTISPECIES: hypothetical protein [Rhizobium]|uniref:Uncharacterized protein n=1 Tax=Rhizobium phaseoli TaxID=396 RepID=A0A7X6J2E1_9HYPH|nr:MULTISPECIES: hypothetical protein [Rhizobium]MDE8763658.1 hypothetical protein [Rhizobium sp. CBK13]NKF14854.1 hypothetical protein [Rhizobium phaseoli]QPK09198.1 hypothetical protein HER27_001030 [Rhizobium phaseoli]